MTAGVLVAALLASVHMEVGDLLGIALPTVSVPIMLAFPVGAVMGDMGASFVKRRFGRARGAAVPGLDQLDFLVAALVLGMLADPDWMSAVFDPALVVTVFVLTPVLHLGTNAGAYVLGLKDEPW